MVEVDLDADDGRPPVGDQPSTVASEQRPEAMRGDKARMAGCPWTGPPVVRVRCPRLREGGQHDMKRRRHTPEQII
jgi:hypothetical protein